MDMLKKIFINLMTVLLLISQNPVNVRANDFSDTDTEQNEWMNQDGAFNSNTDSDSNDENLDNKQQDDGFNIELEPVFYCNKEEHIHNNECYDIYKVLLCSQDHIHNDNCFLEYRFLTCPKTEHLHDKYCEDENYIEEIKEEELTEEEKLILETIQKAINNEDDYYLTCGLDQHEHSPECFEEKEILICESTYEEHEHSKECYETVYTIICEKVEHEHTINCVDIHTKEEIENDLENESDDIDNIDAEIIEETPDEPLLQNRELMEETITLTKSLRAAPVFQDPVEADGIQLQNITIKWLSSSSGSESQARYDDLVLVPENDIIPNQQFQIDFSMSGKGTIPAGSIEIIIPAYIWKTKAGNEPGLLTLAVPEEPSTKQEFAWKRVGDTIVITNTRSLSTASKFMIQGTFRNTSPDVNSIPSVFTSTYAHEMYDLDTKDENAPYKGVSDDLFAVVNIETPRLHEVLTMTSNSIRATIDTHVEIANTTKKAVDNKVYVDEIPTDIPDELLPENPEDYVYVQWYVSATVNGNQNYDMWLQDTVSDIAYNVSEDEEFTVNGMMLGGTSLVAGTVKSEDGKNIRMDLFSGYNLDTSLYSDLSSKTAYIWTAYPRSEFPKDGVTYRLENDVDVHVKGEDDEKETSNSASSQASFKTPVIWKIDKVWNDDENAKGHRPEQLYAFIYDINKPQGNFYKKVKEFYLSDENNWHEEWKDDGTITEYKAREHSWYTNSNTSVIAEGYSEWEIQEDGSRCRTRWWYTFNPSESTYNDDTHTWTFVNDYHETRACEGIIPWVPDRAVLTTNKRSVNHTNTQLKATSDRDISLLSNSQETTEVRFDINSIAAVAPYTLRDGGSLLNPDDYGFKEVEMKIEDKRVSFASLESHPNGALTEEDYEIRYVYLRRPYQYRRVQYNAWSYWTYESLSEKIPVELYGKLNDEWIKYADYSAEEVLTVYNGATIAGSNKVELPANVTHVYTTQKTKADKIEVGYQIGVIFKPSEKIKNYVDSLFEVSDYAITNVYNTERTFIYDDEGIEQMSLESGDRAYLHGRNLRLAVDLDKSFRHSDTNWDSQYLEFSSTITLNQQTNVTTNYEYQTALNHGELPFSESGTFYDLLPPGMTVVLDTVEIDDGTIVTAEAIENYQGSGRTLLIVKALLTDSYSYARYPSSSAKGSDSTYPDEGYYRGHTITFKSQMTFEESRNRGLTDLRNTAAYEADESVFGNIDYWRGEKDDPTYGNNKESLTAIRPDLIDLMTDLDPDRDDPSFVYAQGTSMMTEVDYSAIASIRKYVQVTGADFWTNGHDNDVNVPEAGKYSYNIVLTAGGEDTQTKDIIILDSIENPTLLEITDVGDSDQYHVGDLINETDLAGVNEELIGEGKQPIQAVEVWHWKGYFRSIDVSEIEALGVAPVVYYSTTPSLDISHDVYNPEHEYDAVINKLQDPNGDWTTEMPDDPSKVTAIAIDCRKDVNGNDFVLTNYASLIAYYHMQAPTYDEQPDAFAQEDYNNHLNNAHAYNNVYMDITQVDGIGNTTHSYDYFKYTKVGIYSSNLEVEKIWEDDNNRDGIRPDEVELTLLRNGEPVENRTITITKENDYKGEFEYIPMYDPDGRLYQYGISESAVDDYVSFTSLSGNKFTVKNTHNPERINIPFEKHWTSNEPDGWQENIPHYIEVRLYADGVFTGQRKYVYPAQDGTWTGTFFNLLKYRDEGEEIEYTIQEVVPEDYIVTYSDDTTEITNEYYPYGDIELTKIVKNATEAALDNEFTFTISLLDENDEELTGKYAYQIINTETGEIVDEKTKANGVGHGGRINLKDKEKLIIKDVPNKTKYSISEAAKPGFTLTDKVNDEGVVKSLSTKVATFTNTYASKGLVSLNGKKTLIGRQIRRYAFRFEMLDENRNVLYTTANQAMNPNDNENPSDLNDADIIFPSLSFTDADDGIEKIYYIREVNRETDGYTYDSKEIKIYVTAHDNGNGTMSFDVRYYSYNPETQEESELLNEIVFDNVYEASGEVVLRAWKTLDARKLKNQEFSFELYDEEGNLLQTKHNHSDGTITFDPITYTQDDVGKMFYYTIKEHIPHHTDADYDETVIYDTNVYGYSVYVFDNGNGTLRFTQEPVTPVYADDTQTWETIISSTITRSGYFFYGNNDAVFSDNWYNTLGEVFDHLASTHPELVTPASSDSAYVKLPEGYALHVGDYVIDEKLYIYQGYYSYPDNIPEYELINLNEPAGSSPSDPGPAIILCSRPDAETAIFMYEMPNGNYNAIYPAVGDIVKLVKKGEVIPGEIIDFETEDAPLPIFKNELKDGALAVTKHVIDSPSADPDQKFKFRVKFLNNEKDLSDISWDIADPREVVVTKVWENDSPEDRPDDIKVRIELADEDKQQDIVRVEINNSVSGYCYSYYSSNYCYYQVDEESYYNYQELVENADSSKEYAVQFISGGQVVKEVPFTSDNVYIGQNEQRTIEINSENIIFQDNGRYTEYYGKYIYFSFSPSISVDYNDFYVRLIEKADQYNPDAAHSIPGEWVDNGDNTWSYTFYLPKTSHHYKVWEDATQIITGTGTYTANNNHKNKVDVVDNKATITNTFARDNKFSITYIANGGSFEDDSTENTMIYESATPLQVGDDVSSVPIISGEYKVPNRPGYIFDGWYLDEHTTEPYDETYIGKTIHLYAKWVALSGDATMDASKWLEHYNEIDMMPIETFRKGNDFKRDNSSSNSRAIQFNGIRVDDETTDKEIWCYIDDNDICYLWSDAETIYLPENSSYFFARSSNNYDLDLTWLDASKVENVQMFAHYSYFKTIDISGWDTSKITNMSYMFCGEFNDIKGIEEIDTSQVTDMEFMFGFTKMESLDLSNFNTSNVENMCYMFYGNYDLKELDVSSFNTTKLITAESMFNDLNEITTLDLTSFSTPNLTNTKSMFSHCNNLEHIYVSESWDMSNVTESQRMFAYSPKLPNYISSHNTYAGSDNANVNYAHYGPGGYLDLGPAPTISNNDNNKSFLSLNLSDLLFRKVYAEDDDQNNRNDIEVIKISDNEYEFYLKASESIVFEHIPAGTSYQVYEETPDGWVLVEQHNASGVIQSLDESLAEFKNKYQPGITSVQFSGTKTLDNNPAEEDSFTFELYEGDQLIETVKTLSGGFVQFSVITYEEPGEHTYTIKEKAGISNSIQYDQHEETVFVEVVDNGEGGLTANVTYDEDGINFKNITKPGSLKINKVADKTTNMNKDDEFTVKITFSNENGTPLSDDENIYWYKVDKDGNPIKNNSKNNGLFSFFKRNDDYKQASKFENDDKPVQTNNKPQEDTDEQCLSCELKKAENDKENLSSDDNNIDQIEGNPDNYNEFRITPKNVEIEKSEEKLDNTSYFNFDFFGLIKIVHADDFDHNDGVIEVGEEFTVTYDATENGQFDNGERYNVVKYRLEGDTRREYSHTSNIDDDGNESSTYNNNEAFVDVVTIPGASKIKITITGDTEQSYDYVNVFEGNIPSASPTSTSPLSGRLSGEFDQEYIIDGDSVTFTFKSDGGTTKYGYYAIIEEYSNNDIIVQGGKNYRIIEGEYKEPVYTGQEDSYSFVDFSNSLDRLTGDGSVIALYDKAPIAYGFYDGVLWKIIEEDGKTKLLFGDPNIDQKFDDVDRVRRNVRWKYKDNHYYLTSTTYPWLKYSDEIQEVSFIGNVKGSKDMTALFEGLSSVKEFDLDKFDVSEVEDFSYMFSGIGYLSEPIVLDLSTFDTSNGKNFSHMFTGIPRNGTPSYEYDLYYNVGKIEQLILGPNFTTENAEDISFMFAGSRINNINEVLSRLNTSNVTNMSGLFAYIFTDDLDVSSLDTTNTTDMSGMFAHTQLESLDLRHFNTSNVTNMSHMFKGRPNSTSVNPRPDLGITYLDISTFDLSNVENFDYMFYATVFDTLLLPDSHSTKPNTAKYMFAGADLSNIDFASVHLDNTYDATSMFFSSMHRSSSNNEIDMSALDVSDIQIADNMFHSFYVKKVDVSDWDFSNVTSMSYFLYSASTTEMVGLNDLDVSNVEDFSYCFGYTNFPSIDVSNWNTVSGENYEYMFYNSKATEIEGLDNFDVTNAKSFYSMFFESYVKKIIVPSWSPENLESVVNMFRKSRAEDIDISGLDTRNIPMNESNYNSPGGYNMFTEALMHRITLGPNFSFYGTSSPSFPIYLPGTAWDNIDTKETRTVRELSREYDSSATNLHGTWQRTLTKVVFDEADGSLRFYSPFTDLELTSTQTVYEVDYDKSYSNYNVPWKSNNYKITKVIVEDEISPIYMDAWFSELNKVTYWDLEKLDTSRTEKMTYTFYRTSNLPSDIIKSFNMENVSDASYMFSGVRNTEAIDLSNKDLRNLIYANGMFSDSRELKDINFDGMLTSNKLYEMRYMFYNTEIDESPLDKFNTSKVRNMEAIFKNTKITEVDFRDIDLSSLTNASSMFADTPLEKADFTGVDLSRLSNASYMFSKSYNSYYYNNKMELDKFEIIGMDTSHVTNMDSMFYGIALKSGTLDLTWLDTTSVTSSSSTFSNITADVLDLTGVTFENSRSMYNMFGGDSYYSERNYIGELIIPDINTRKAVIDNYYSSSGIFSSSNFAAVTLGENFYFGNSGYNPLYIPDFAWLGKTWVRDDYEVGPYTPDEMQRNYIGEMAGRYIREKKYIEFNPNGGHTVNNGTIEAAKQFTMPIASDVTNPGHQLLGWSKYSDALEPTYAPGELIEYYNNEIGDVFYAVWKYDGNNAVIVNHYQENVEGTRYNLAETEEIRDLIGTSVNVEPKDYPGFHLVNGTAETVTIPEEEDITKSFYYARDRYTIKFNSNGADLGIMPSKLDGVGGVSQKLPDNQYTKKGALFIGWNTSADGSGQSFLNGEEIVNIGQDGETVTLYAQWQTNENELTPTHGVIYVTMKAGESIVIPDLPYGTTYTIEEVDLPAGWQLDTISGSTGSIEPNTTNTSTLRNKYVASGQAIIEVHKLLQGGSLQDGQFEFRLTDNSGVTLQTKSNGPIDNNKKIAVDGYEVDNPWYGTGLVQFDPIEYTTADIGRYYTYYIYENDTGDDKINYNLNAYEYVEVYVYDGGNGNLMTNVSYWNSRRLFTNTMKPGDLRLSKSILNQTDSAKDTEFEYELKLYDAENNEINGTYKAKVKHADYYVSEEDLSEEVRYSHTSNINDEGVVDGSYSNALNTIDVIRIPGAQGLKVSIRYQTEQCCDFVQLWKGTLVNAYYPDQSDAELVVDSLRGGSFDNTYEYIIPGDTTSIRFCSDYSVVNYGYYAVITSTSETGMVEHNYHDTTVTTGETFKLKGNETIEIYGLPHGARYELVEKDADGWELLSSEGNVGNIEANATKNAAFTNVYSTVGGITIEANKLLFGDDLENHEFEFELTDINGNVLSTASPDKDGVIKFSSISYDQDDDGMLYTYYIREVKDADNEIINEWDEHLLEFNVGIQDNGKGSLSTNVTLDARNTDFRNYVLRSLDVSKNVEGNYGEKDKDFSFILNLGQGWNEHEITYTKTSFSGLTTNGVVDSNPYNFTLKHNETIKFDGLIKGLEYDVVDVKEDRYESSAKDGVSKNDGLHVSGTLDDDKSIKYTNTRNEYLDIYVNKKVHLDADTTTEFSFNIELTNLDPNTTYTTNVGSIKSDKDGKYTGTFKLKANQQFKINDVPVYTEYTISEEDYSDDFITKVSKILYGAYIDGREVSGTIDTINDVNVSFMNMPLTSIEVKKNVTGNYAEKDREFRFGLYIDDPDVPEITYSKAGQTGVVEFNDDHLYNFTLKHNESIVFDGLIKGMEYTVYEFDANTDDYVSSVDSGVLDEDGLYVEDTVSDGDSIVFTNTRNKYQNIVVTKNTIGNVDSNEEFKFTIKFTNLEPNTRYTTTNGNFTSDASGEATKTFTLKKDESLVINQLPFGCSYTVKEDDYSSDGYYTSVKLQNNDYEDARETSGTINELKDVHVKFLNTATASIEVTKKVDGNYPELDKEFKFELHLSGELWKQNEVTWKKGSESGVVDAETGVFIFRLANDEKMIFNGIVKGSEYEIIEVDANTDRYISTVVDGVLDETGLHVSGTLDTNRSITYTNTRNEYQDIKVGKYVVNNVDSEIEFSFNIELSNLEANTTYNSTSGEFTSNSEGRISKDITLKSKDIFELYDIPVNSKFTITEKIDSTSGYKTKVYNSIDNKFVDDNTTSATVPYLRDEGYVGVIFFNYETEEINGTKSWLDGDLSHDNDKEIKLEVYRYTDDEDMKLIDEKDYKLTWFDNVFFITNLEKHAGEKDYKYLVKEIYENKEYVISYEYDEKENTHNLINEKNKGEFTISKKVEGDIADVNKEFTFNITLTNSEGKPVSGIFSDVEFVDGKASVKLKHDESITIETYLDVNYIVEEDPEDYIANIDKVSGVVSLEEKTYEFVNTLNEKEKFGDLQVSKQVDGSVTDVKKEFSFTIELSDSTVDGVYGDMTFLNGVANITLKHNETKIAKQLPAGISYKVRELEEAGYNVSYENSDGIIEADRIAVCNVINKLIPSKKPEPDKPPYVPPRTGINKENH